MGGKLLDHDDVREKLRDIGSLVSRLSRETGLSYRTLRWFLKGGMPKKQFFLYTIVIWIERWEAQEKQRIHFFKRRAERKKLGGHWAPIDKCSNNDAMEDLSQGDSQA